MDARMKRLGYRTLFCLALVSSCSWLEAGEVPGHKIHSDRDGLPLEVPCRIHTSQAGERETHFGKILRVTPEWIVMEHFTTTETPSRGHAPAIKQTSAELLIESSEVWIPRSAIVKVTFTRSRTISTSRLQPIPDNIEQCEIEEVSMHRTKPVKVLPRNPDPESVAPVPNPEEGAPDSESAPEQPLEPKTGPADETDDNVSERVRPGTRVNASVKPPASTPYSPTAHSIGRPLLFTVSGNRPQAVFQTGWRRQYSAEEFRFRPAEKLLPGR